MSKIYILNSIEEILIDLKTSFDNMKTESQIPNIQIDLNLTKLQSLYDYCLKLKTIEFSQNTESIITEPIKIEEILIEEPKINISKIVEETTIKEIETVIKEELEPITEKIIEIEKFTLQKEIKISKEKEIIADRFENKKSINEQSPLKKNLASSLKNNPISSINSAINISDKFMFIKELFNNNPNSYNETIEMLNNFENLDQAMHYINTEFNWEPNNLSFKKLIDIVYRRYINH